MKQGAGEPTDVFEVSRLGYCIGCGLCALKVPGKLEMRLDERGFYRPVGRGGEPLNEAEKEASLAVCPFSGIGPDETKLSADRFPEAAFQDAGLGRFESLWIGHSSDPQQRSRGSSGGLATWLLTKLLSTGLVDSVIHVRQTHDESDLLFRYSLSTTVSDVVEGAKTRYYPVELSKVLSFVADNPGRYAVVGLPCFIKAVRRLCRQDAVFASRIAFTVGLVCGHLKSTAFSEAMAWESGIPPGHLTGIDFRVKLPGRLASDYGVELSEGSRGRIVPKRDLFTTNWGENHFRNSACDFCDDVFAETSDISIGDAWLADKVTDPLGTSVVVVRDKELDGLIRRARESLEVRLEETTVERIRESQAGGLRDRREGLAVRIQRKRDLGLWVPPKRDFGARLEKIEAKRRQIYATRQDLGEQSHTNWAVAKSKDDFRVYPRLMRPGLKRLSALNTTMLGRLRRLVGAVFRVLTQRNPGRKTNRG